MRSRDTCFARQSGGAWLFVAVASCWRHRWCSRFRQLLKVSVRTRTPRKPPGDPAPLLRWTAGSCSRHRSPVRPADRRADAISDRLNALASDAAFPPEGLQVINEEGQARIVARDQTVMFVRDADARLEGLTHLQLAALIRERTVEAIKAYRYDRSRRILMRHALYALGATASLFLLLWPLVRAFGRIHTVTEPAYRARAQKLRIQSFELVRADRLWASLLLMERTLKLIVILAVVFFYFQFVLALFPWTRPVAHSLFSILWGPLLSMELPSGGVAAQPGIPCRPGHRRALFAQTGQVVL